jgi:hypothetical protein
MTLMGWTVSFEAKGEIPAALDDALEEFLDLLVDRGGAASSSTVGDRYSATFNIDEDVEDAATAVALGCDIFTKLADKSGLPTWPVVRAEGLTFDEQDRELDSPNFPELAGVSEIADILGVTRQRASALAKTTDFPAPVATLASGPVWTRPSLNRFVDTWPRRDGRPPKLATLTRELLRAVNEQPFPAFTPETHAILHTPDEAIAEKPYLVLVRLAQALDGELTRMRTFGRSEAETAIVQGWLDETVQTMSGYSVNSE